MMHTQKEIRGVKLPARNKQVRETSWKGEAGKVTPSGEKNTKLEERFREDGGGLKEDGEGLKDDENNENKNGKDNEDEDDYLGLYCN